MLGVGVAVAVGVVDVESPDASSDGEETARQKICRR